MVYFLKKLIYNELLLVISILTLLIAVKTIVNADLMPEVTKDFNEISKSNFNYVKNDYVSAPGTNSPTSLLNQPNNPQFPIKKIWANYVRDGKITKKTSKIFVVMPKVTNIGLPSITGFQTNNVYMNLYSNVEIGTSYKKESIIDNDFFNKSPNSKGKIINDTEFKEMPSAQFNEDSFYELLSSNSSNEILDKNDSTTVYKLGPKVELARRFPTTYNNYTNYMYTIKASNNLTVTPGLNDLKAGDKTVKGTGQQVGDTITVTKNDALMGKTNVDSNGNWNLNLNSSIKSNENITVTEHSPIPGDIDGTVTKKVTIRNDLPIHVYPIVIGNTQINGYDSEPGATVTIGTGFTANQKTTVVDKNGNWQLPISASDRIWGTTYYFTIKDSDENTGETKFDAIGLKAVADFDFGTINLNKLNYNELIPLTNWGGLTFDGDITNANPWMVNISKTGYFGNNIKMYYQSGKNVKKEVTATPQNFLNNFKDSDNEAVIQKNIAKMPQNSNLYLDISDSKNAIISSTKKEYTAKINVSLIDVPR